MQAVQPKLQEASRQYHELEKALSTAIANRQVLEGQNKENELVLQELKLVAADASVYKLVGSILLKQEAPEAVNNVTKRLDFITAEITKTDSRINELRPKLGEKEKEIIEIQKMLSTSNNKEES